MKFQDSRFWLNYQKYDSIVGNSSMRSTIDGLIYWKLLTSFKFKKFLEIGVYQGLTTGLFFETNNDAEVLAVDPAGKLSLFYNLYPEHKNNLTFINEKSEDAKIPDGLYDFILIDGDHSYEPAIHDIKSCLPRMSNNSILALDDYKLDGVQRAISDLHNMNTDWVPFLQAEQTQFWHHKSADRANFLDALLIDPISNFIFIENITDEYGNVICSAKTLNIFTNELDIFDSALKKYNI